MKVSAEFNERGLSLNLTAESDAERAMIGAVLNQPQNGMIVSPELLTAEICSSAHFTYKKVDSLKLRLHRYEADQ